MLGVDAESVTLAAAFLLGAVFATVATLRIVRAVMVLFEDGPPRRRPPRRRDPPAG